MIAPDDARKVDIALPTIVASIGAWGVVESHWLPDVDGNPAVWLTVPTEIQRVQLEAQPWVTSQVTMLLMRQNVPYAVTRRMRVFVDSLEGRRELLGETSGSD